MKKLLCAFLAVCMILGAGITAFATEGDTFENTFFIDMTQWGHIVTITNQTRFDGDTYGDDEILIIGVQLPSTFKSLRTRKLFDDAELDKEYPSAPSINLTYLKSLDEYFSGDGEYWPNAVTLNAGDSLELVKGYYATNCYVDVGEEFPYSVIIEVVDTAPPPILPPPPQGPFPGASGWALEELADALEANLIPDGFAGEGWRADTSRFAAAEVVCDLIQSILRKSKEEIAEEKGWDLNENQFDDTNDACVTFLKYAGVTTGVGDNKYGLTGGYQRVHFVTMIGRAAEVFFGNTFDDTTNPFTDEIPAWAEKYVGFFSEAGIVRGDGGKFNSFGFLTNEQTIAFTLRSFNFFTAQMES